MIKIFEKTQQLNDISNHQSRMIECESFQYYLDNIELPKNCEVYQKYINYSRQTITFLLEIKFKERWVEYIHYAEVIG